MSEKSYSEMLEYVIKNNGNCFENDCSWCQLKRFCFAMQKQYSSDREGFVNAFKKELEGWN